MRDAFAAAARTQRVWVVAGLNRVEGPPRRNVALVFDPDGEMVLEYQKVHLVPSFEDEYSVGHFPAPFPTPAGTWGVAICRDLLYTDVGRANSLARVGLLLVPAWDFGNDAEVMARIAAMRAVEGGFAVVRAAQVGLVAVSDDRGRLVAQMATNGRPDALLTVDVASGSAPTLYARGGDWFAWLMSGMAAAVVVAVAVDAIRLRRRARVSEPRRA